MTAPTIVHNYIDAGLRVLPIWPVRDGRCGCGKDSCRLLPDGTTVGSPGKHPIAALVRHGLDDATLDHEVVDAWAKRITDTNWAVRPAHGLAVVDVDPRHGGASALAALTAEHEPLPKTLAQRTGGGGLHVWFRWSGPVPGKIGKGLDLKGPAGYLLVEPSVHISGGRYEWITDHDPADPPRWLRDLLNPPARAYVPPVGRGERGIDALVRFVAGIPPRSGEGNHALHWAACRAAEEGLDPAPLIDAAVGRGTPHREAVGTVRSAYRRAAA